MRTINSFNYLAIFLLTLATIIYSQEEFPVGAFVGSAPNFPNAAHPSNDENFWQIEEMGLNWVIAVPTQNNQDSLNRFNIIALRPHELTDYIHYYSSAYYTRWEAEEVHPDYSTGMKQIGGAVEGEYYTSGSTYTDKPNFLCGPNYAQDKKYKIWQRLGETINYRIRIRYKIEGPETEEVQNVCKITLKYYYKHSDPAELDSLEIGTYHLTTAHATGNFENFDSIAAFNYQALIDTFDIKEGKVASEKVLNYFDDLGKDMGLNIRFDYYGAPNKKLYIDYIEVYDEEIGEDIINGTPDIPLLILNQISQYSTIVDTSNGGKLRYWYGHDEPVVIDNHYAYKMVDDILANNGYPHQRLITAHQPMWNKSLNGDDTMLRFIETAQPAKYMFDFYPVQEKWWSDSNIVNGSFKTLSNLSFLLQSAHNYSPDFFYIPQTHDLIDDDNVKWLRQPTAEELNAQVMLSLAHGVKGIFFYKYYSSTDQSALVSLPDTSSVPYYYSPSHLYSTIKNDIAPRLKYDLGPVLNKLEYTGEYIHFITGNSVDTLNGDFEGLNYSFTNIQIDDINNLDLSVVPSEINNQAHFHVGHLENPNDSDAEYFFITNLICLSNKNAYLTFNITPTSYQNIAYSTVGTNTIVETHHSSSSLVIEIDLSAGQGELIQVAPVLKYGGNLVYDDTVSTALNLSEPMTIKPNATLTLKNVYTMSEDVYVQDGGMVEAKLYGGIAFNNDAKLLFADWSDGLVISQNSDHPKLYWTEYPSEESSLKYEIYRKKESPNFQLVHTITDKTVTEYTDTEVDVMLIPGANPTNAQYYVKVYERPSKAWIEQDQTITVRITPVEGEAQEKKLAEGIIITEYGLEQNHPNPFNPSTTIIYQVPKTSRVRLTIYDILGKEVMTLLNETKEMGRYHIRFDASQLASGTYIYRMEAGKYLESKKMIILK